jgi:hypothetical protein
MKLQVQGIFGHEPQAWLSSKDESQTYMDTSTKSKESIEL